MARSRRLRTLGTPARPVRAYSEQHIGDALRWNEVNAWVGSQTGVVPDSPPYWWVGSSEPGLPWGDATGPYGYSAAGGWLPAVTRATEVLVGPVLRMPWRSYDGDRWYGPRTEVPPYRWITDPQLAAGSDGKAYSRVPFSSRMSRHEFWSMWVKSALWFGVGAFYYEVSNERYVGEPVNGSLRLLHPAALSQDPESGRWVIGGMEWAGEEVEPLGVGDDGYFRLGGALHRLAVVRGPGVLALHAADFGVAAKIRTYTAGQYSAGVPAGYLKVNSPSLPQTAAEELKSSWLRAHGGDKRSIAVLSSVVDFNPIALSPVDAALSDARRSSLHDIALAFNLDPRWLGVAVGGMEYSNNEMNRAELVDLSIAPIAARVEEAISTLHPVGKFCEIDFTAFRKPIGGDE